MIEMTLSSRHRTRNSSPGGLRPSTLPLGPSAENNMKPYHNNEQTRLVLWVELKKTINKTHCNAVKFLKQI